MQLSSQEYPSHQAWKGKVIMHRGYGTFFMQENTVILGSVEEQKTKEKITGSEIFGILTENTRSRLKPANATFLEWYLTNPDQVPKEWSECEIYFLGTVFVGEKVACFSPATFKQDPTLGIDFVPLTQNLSLIPPENKNIRLALIDTVGH